jgi:hypothetical protein
MRSSFKVMGMMLSVSAMLAFASVAMSADTMAGMSHEQKSTDKSEVKTISGEVIDTGCYAEHGAIGEKHASCAEMCIQSGVPAGIVDAKGNVYVVLGEGHGKTPAQVVKGMEGKQVTATGKIVSKGGTTFIVVSKIAESKSDSKATSGKKTGSSTEEKKEKAKDDD